MFSFLEKTFNDISEIVAPITNSNQLHLAVQHNRNSEAKYLIEMNSPEFNIHRIGDSGVGVIHLACRYNNMEVLNLITATPYHVTVEMLDSNGNTPLHYACKYGNLEICKYLLNAGAKIMKKNKAGQTAYDISENHNVRQYLLPLTFKEQAANGDGDNNNTSASIQGQGGQAYGLHSNAGAGAGAGVQVALGDPYCAKDAIQKAAAAAAAVPPPMASGENLYASNPAALTRPTYAEYTNPYGAPAPSQSAQPAHTLVPPAPAGPAVNNFAAPVAIMSGPGPSVGVPSLVAAQTSQTAPPVNTIVSGSVVLVAAPAAPVVVAPVATAPVAAVQVETQMQTQTNAVAKSASVGPAAPAHSITPSAPAKTEAAISAPGNLAQVQLQTQASATVSKAPLKAPASVPASVPAPISVPIATAPHTQPVVAGLAAPPPRPTFSPLPATQTTAATITTPPVNNTAWRGGAMGTTTKTFMPDGFHSSSNDATLQAKYGHSKTLKNIAPPPIFGAPAGASGSVMPPPTGLGLGSAVTPGVNPYSAYASSASPAPAAVYSAPPMMGMGARPPVHVPGLPTGKGGTEMGPPQAPGVGIMNSSTSADSIHSANSNSSNSLASGGNEPLVSVSVNVFNPGAATAATTSTSTTDVTSIQTSSSSVM